MAEKKIRIDSENLPAIQATVDYVSPLSQQEIRDYELAPANMVQKPVAAVIERSEQNGLHELARDAG